MRDPRHNIKTGGSDWGADCLGEPDRLPSSSRSLISRLLRLMATEPAFSRARRQMLDALALTVGSRVLEAGSGTGSALPDLIPLVGQRGQIVGVDAAAGFAAEAQSRAETAGWSRVAYVHGDVRSLPFSDDGFDAAFCDKLLLHVGPASRIVAELRRVVRPGGRIGVLEWQPQLAISTSAPELEETFNAVLRQASHWPAAGPNLGRLFLEAGLEEVASRSYLAEAQSLADHPFWPAFLIDQLALFVALGLLADQTARTLAADLRAIDQAGGFRAGLMIWTVVGTKPAGL